MLHTHLAARLAARLMLPALILICLAATALGDQPNSRPEALHARIDHMIAAAHVGPLAPRCSDAEFLRRASLDLNGVIPTAEEVRAFLADASPDKRERLVDRLLASPRYALHMTDVLDVMLMERRPDKNVKSPEWRKWLRESLASNKPYNLLAAEILGADGVDPQQRAAAKFYLDRDAETNLLTRDVGRMFFGRDLQCAQCHDHPLIDDYLQEDYYGIYAFLNRSYVFKDPKLKTNVLAEKAEGNVDFKSVFTGEEGNTLPRLPGGEAVAEPALKKGEEYKVKPAKNVRGVPKYSRREQLARLAGEGQNDAFNRNIVNRLWAQMMGRGIVDPPDLHHSDNPPSHPELLALLADEFAAMKYDMQALLRELALTETYQRSFELPADLEQSAKAASEELAGLEKQREMLAAAQQDAMKAAGDAVSALVEAKKAASGSGDKEKKQADSAVAAAKQAVAKAQQEIQAAEQQLAERRKTAEVLAQAAAAAKQAADRLAGDKELAKAAAQFAERSKAFPQQVAESEKLVAARKQESQQAAQRLSAAEKAAAELLAKAEAAKKQIAAVEQTVAKAEASRAAAGEALKQFEQQLDATRQIAEFAAIADEARDVRQKLAQADQSTDDHGEKQLDDKQLAEAEAQLGRYESALAELSEQFARRFAVATLKPLSPEQLAWSMLQSSGQLEAQRAAAAAELDKKEAAKKEAAKNEADKKDKAKKDADKKESSAADKKDEPAKEPKGAEVGAAKQANDNPLAREAQIEDAARAKLQGTVNAFVNLFAAAPGTPQQDFVATVDQALFFSNGSQVRSLLAPSGTNLTARCAKLEGPAVAEELYLSILGRLPDEAETAAVVEYLAAQADARPAAVQEMAWGLLTSVEFRFNH